MTETATQRRRWHTAKMVGLALVVPPLIMEALEICSRLISMRMYQSGGPDRLALWLGKYGIVFVLLSVALGIVFLLRGFERRYALLLAIPYVPLMVLFIQFVGLAVAGFVFGDSL